LIVRICARITPLFYRKMIEIFTVHNKYTTVRHNEVKPIYWTPLHCVLMLCTCCALWVQESLPFLIFHERLAYTACTPMKKESDSSLSWKIRNTALSLISPRHSCLSHSSSNPRKSKPKFDYYALSYPRVKLNLVKLYQRKSRWV
jgi:hypothetical protein